MKFCLASHVTAADRDKLLEHADALSRVAPLAADLAQHVVLAACEGAGEWPPLHTAKQVTNAVGSSPAQAFFQHTYKIGRQGTTRTATVAGGRPAALGQASRAAANPLVAAAFAAMGSPPRPARLHGDSTILAYQAAHAHAMFNLRCGANAVHGVPSVMSDSLRASLLRGIYAHTETLPTGGAEAAFWATMVKGKAIKALAHHARLVVMGVTFFGPPDPTDAKHRKVTRSKAIDYVLAEPFVKEIITWHSNVLNDIPNANTRSVDGDAGPARHQGAQKAALDKYNSAPVGSWASFAAHLELQ